jgi:hypothetical protein
MADAEVTSFRPAEESLNGTLGTQEVTTVTSPTPLDAEPEVYIEVVDAPPAPLHGCIECKAQRTYTTKAWPNGNTTWHCTVCGKVLRLVPGRYS